jgi:hypothetical protein
MLKSPKGKEEQLWTCATQSGRSSGKAESPPSGFCAHLPAPGPGCDDPGTDAFSLRLARPASRGAHHFAARAHGLGPYPKSTKALIDWAAAARAVHSSGNSAWRMAKTCSFSFGACSLGCRPHERPVDSEIIVHQDISQGDDVSPGDFWMPSSDILAETPGGLANDCQALGNCKTHALVAKEFCLRRRA